MFLGSVQDSRKAQLISQMAKEELLELVHMIKEQLILIFTEVTKWCNNSAYNFAYIIQYIMHCLTLP